MSLSNKFSASSAAVRPPCTAGPVFHLATLAALAISQPLYDLLGRQPELLVAHQISRLEMLGLVAMLAIVVPAMVAAVAWLTSRLMPRAGVLIRGVWVAVLSAAIVLPALHRIVGFPAVSAVAGAAAVGTGLAVLDHRTAGFRLLLRYLTPVLVLLPILFCARPAIRELLLTPAAQPMGIHVPRTTPVIMVVFDELTLPSLLDVDGEIDAQRFPGFARLTSQSTWFRKATAVAEGTIYALPAILSGRYPAEGRLPTARHYPHNLFSLLASSHRLQVVETHTTLCPGAGCDQLLGPPAELPLATLLRDVALIYPHFLLPEALTAGLPPVTDHWRILSRETNARLQLDYLDKFERALGSTGTEPTLFFLHSMLPHTPWRLLPSGRHYGRAGLDLPGHVDKIWVDDEWLRLQGLQRYLLQLAAVDRRLGRLLDVLEAGALFDQALVIVTADHGVSFQAGHPHRLVDPKQPSAIASVPLFVKLPGQQLGGVSDRPVELIDLMPTLTEVLGFTEPPWPMDGVSLLSEAPPPRPMRAIFGHRNGKWQRFEVDSTAATGEAPELRRLLDRFEPGIAGIWRPDLGRHLLDRPVGDLVISDIELKVDQPERYQALDPNRRQWPVRVTGEAISRNASSDSAPLLIAITNQDIVRAVTRSYRDDRDRTRFSAMLPEDALLAGENRIEAVVIDIVGTAAPEPARLLSNSKPPKTAPSPF